MGTNNTIKAAVPHSCPILERDLVEEDFCELQMETASLVAAAAVLAHVGIASLASYSASLPHLMN